MEALSLIFAGTTLLHLGAAFLNDFFDADYDKEHHPQRPNPSGAIAAQTVWRWGLGWLVGGALLLICAGTASGSLGLVLVFLIVLYNTIHRLLPFAPVLQGLARLFLYLLGASAALRGVTGVSIWCGLALGAYTTGTGYFERWKDTPARARLWPALLLAGPILLALIMDADGYRESGLLLSAVVFLWGARSLRQTFWSLEPDIHSTIRGLVAGIIFVDWLAVCPVSLVGEPNPVGRQLSFAFLALFAATLILQRLELKS